jgi:hypothetical protein
MELWRPSPDQPELFDWWRPLLQASRRARDEHIFWPIHVDEFRFHGRIERGKRPAIWVYEHRTNGGEVLADWQGQTYGFIPYRRGPSLGRFQEISVRHAVWRARLPDVVKPVWYDEPRGAPLGHADGTGSDADGADTREPTPPVRRGHLYLVPSPSPN